MMDISYVETAAELPDPYTSTGRRLVIVIDNKTEITVYGPGSGDYQIRLRNIGGGDPDYDPAALIGQPDPVGAEFWGAALVWAHPRTIAHLVMDAINEQ